MAQHTINREDYAHPERVYKDLIYAPDGTVSYEEGAKREGLIEFLACFEGNPKEAKLCWSCGWIAYNELTASYGSRLQIFHTRANMGMWEVGRRWIIRDQPNDMSLGNDFITQEFLLNQKTSISLVEKMQKLSDPTDDVEITLMSRAQGVTLDKVWHTLSPEQKMNYKDQLASAIKSLRQFTAPVASKVDGSLLNDCIIGYCGRHSAPTCKKIGRTTGEWLDDIEQEVRLGLAKIYVTRDSKVIDEKLAELRKNFPKSEPYVLTHGDLNFTNIFVKDDKIEAIIDWELSGYFPWWAERWISLIRADERSDELFEPLWADIGIEMDEDTFQRDVIETVAPVIEAWREAQFDIEHTNQYAEWLRPGFCKCQPYAGHFKWEYIGNQLEHKLKRTV